MTKYDEAVAGLTDTDAKQFLLDELNGQLCKFDQRKCDVLTFLHLPKIPPIPLSILIYLWDRQGRVVSKDVLCAVVEQEHYMLGTHVSDVALSSHVKRLRHAIDANGWPLEVDIYNNLGYVMTAFRDWSID